MPRHAEKQVSDFDGSLVGNATDTCGSLRTRLLILHWISHSAGARPFGKRDALTEATVENRLDSLKQKGVVTVCQEQQQIFNASEEVLNTATSRRCQLRSVKRTLLCACVVALVPYGSVFAQAPCMEHCDRLPASKTMSLHELSHHVPGRAVKEYERALKAANEGEKENSIPHYQKAIAADPEFLAAINNLGITYLDLNRVDVAIEQFTKAIAMDPHSAPPHVNLAIAYLRQGRFADAERAARRAVDLDRVNRYGRLILGVSSIMNGNFTTEAERSLTQAAQEYTVAKAWLAIGLAAKGDIANARDHLRTYVSEVGNASSNLAINLLKEIESASPGR
jgi:tetratricopeptide (TPR) repeat protein